MSAGERSRYEALIQRAERADAVVALCAGALFNLSSDPDTAPLLMSRKWIRGVISLMKQSQMSRVDELSIATLHNLSTGFERAGHVYAGEGALEELIELANNDEEPSAQGKEIALLFVLLRSGIVSPQSTTIP